MPGRAVALRRRGFSRLSRSNKVDQAREDAHFRVLRLIESRPNLSQRDISDALGLSLGSVNYCLKALTEKGCVKVNNFRASDNKLRYAYILTPSGISERAKLTARFLKRKMREYEALKAEIDALQHESFDRSVSRSIKP
ncbi:MAG: MarR family EPS-associated transcriptional regulator [Beijerinckiaceae bacterium]